MAQRDVPSHPEVARPDAALAHELGLRAALGHGRLRLAGLDPATRRLAVLALLVLGGASSAIVLVALGIPFPGGTIEIPGRMVAEAGVVAVPILAVAGSLLGLAGLSAVMAAAALAVPRPTARLLLAGCAAAGAAAAAPALTALPGAAAIAGGDPVAWWALALGGGTAIAASAAIALLAPFAPRLAGAGTRTRIPVVALAAVPGIALTAATVAGLAGGTPIPTPRPDGLESYPDTLHLASAAVAGSLFGTLARLLPLLVMPIVVWEAATWARASRAELAAPVVRRVDARSWLLPGVLTAKLAWLALGYAGWLPAALGGQSPAWETSRAAGPVAWAMAIAWAAGAGLWLAVRDAPGVTERSIRPGLRLLVAGFTGGSAAAAMMLLAGAILLLLPDDTLALAVMAAAGVVGDAAIWLQVGSVAVGTVAGAVLVRRGNPAGAFLVVAGAWMAPRAAFVVATTLGLVPPDADSPVGLDLATMDAALTIAIGLLAVAWAAGRRPGLDPGALALALAVTTLMAHGTTLVPIALTGVLATTAILFPPLRTLLFGAADLNREAAVRPARVLSALGRLGAALLAVAGTYAVVGVPASVSAAELGNLLFGPPYAALLVAASITVRRAASIPVAAGARDGPAVPGATWRRLAGSAAGGILAVALAWALTGAVVDPAVGWAWRPVPSDAPPAAPSPSTGGTATAGPTADPSPGEDPDDAVAFRALAGGVAVRMDAIGRIFAGAFSTAQGAELADAGDQVGSLAREARAWLQDQAPRPCLATYAAATDAYFEATGVVGAEVAAFARGSGSEASVAAAFAALDASLDAVEPAVADAAAACGAAVP